jgi:hypothetical protein
MAALVSADKEGDGRAAQTLKSLRSVRSLAGIPPTPFDMGLSPLFGQPLLKQNVFDGGAGAVVQLCGGDPQDLYQSVTVLDWDRTD